MVKFSDSNVLNGSSHVLNGKKSANFPFSTPEEPFRTRMPSEEQFCEFYFIFTIVAKQADLASVLNKCNLNAYYS